MRKTLICTAILFNVGAAFAEEKPFVCFYDDHADYTTVESAPANAAIGEVSKSGYSGDKVYSYTISARDSTACPNQVPLAKSAITVALVRQDSSNCANEDISAAEPAVLGGSVTIYRVSSRASGANMHLVGTAPDTTYALYQKCGGKLGTLKTDANGKADSTFNFQPESSSSFAFEIKPENGASGPSYHSVKIAR